MIGNLNCLGALYMDNVEKEIPIKYNPINIRAEFIDGVYQVTHIDPGNQPIDFLNIEQLFKKKFYNQYEFNELIQHMSYTCNTDKQPLLLYLPDDLNYLLTHIHNTINSWSAIYGKNDMRIIFESVRIEDIVRISITITQKEALVSKIDLSYPVKRVTILNMH
jgi:hypothetical protein